MLLGGSTLIWLEDTNQIKHEYYVRLKQWSYNEDIPDIEYPFIEFL